MANVTENILLTNFVSTSLTADILAGDLSCTIGQGSSGMPDIDTRTDQYFYLVFQKISAPTIREIVKCTAIAVEGRTEFGTILTIVRGQEGTTPLAWTVADTRIKLNITAATLEDLTDEITAVVDYVDYADPTAADQTDAATDNSIANIMARYGATTYHTIILRPGTYTVTDDFTTDIYTSFAILGGAEFDINVDGKTLTIQGGVIAPRNTRIATEGLVSGSLMSIPNQECPVEWWGALTTDTTNNHLFLDGASRGCKHLIFGETSNADGYFINTSFSFNANTEFLEFRNSASLYADSGTTVTFTNQEIIAPFTANILMDNGGTYDGEIANNPISVHWRGAIGDGVAEDQDAILAILTLAGSNSVIEFANDKIYLTRGVNFPLNSTDVTIVGGHFRADNDAPDVSSGVAGAIFTLSTGNPKCTFRDGFYEVPDTVGAGDIACIKIVDATDCQIYNNRFEGMKATSTNTGQVIMDGAFFCQVHNNIFLRETEEEIVSGSFIVVQKGNEFSAIPFQNNVSNNICRGKALNGILFSSESGTCSNNSIDLDAVDGGEPGTCLIYVDNDNNTISGNTLKHTPSGTVTASLGDGICAGPDVDNLVIFGNNVTGADGTGDSGIDINAGANYVIISSNVLEGNTNRVTVNAGATNITQIGIVGVSDVPYVLFHQKQSEGVASGGVNVANTWNRRVLTHEVSDVDGLAALSSGDIVLEAGIWRIHIVAEVYDSNDSCLRFRNITDSSTAVLGVNSSQTGDGQPLAGQFTISAQKTMRVEHWTQSANANGQGVARAVAAPDTEDELYCTVELWKVGEA